MLPEDPAARRDPQSGVLHRRVRALPLHRKPAVCPALVRRVPGSPKTGSITTYRPEPSGGVILTLQLFAAPRNILRIWLASPQSPKPLIRSAPYQCLQTQPDRLRIGS